MGKDKKKLKPNADVRFPRKSGTGINPFPKKGGTGGKFTWTGDVRKTAEPDFMSDPNDVLYVVG